MTEANPNWRQLNMQKATEARMRAAEEKTAEKLRARGWTCNPPTERGDK